MCPDLLFYGNQNQLEYDFVVAPGADPKKIQLAFDGAEKISLDAGGDLVLHTKTGEVRQHRPRIYQEIDGKQKPVGGRYVVAGKTQVSFEVDSYDARRALVIDPVLSYSTYIGGRNTDTALSITLDASGNAYLVGGTNSSSFPRLNAYQSRLGNNVVMDAFVTKLNATGTALVYSTFLGGSSGIQYTGGIAVDSSGYAYVAGHTSTSDFPTTTGAYQKGVSGGGAFVTKLATAGNALVYSTYVLNATARGIAIDTGGNAYVTGDASSAYVTTAGAFQTANNNTSGHNNAFVLKLNATGSVAAYSTFLGGNGANLVGAVGDVGNAIVVDSHGYAYVGGATNSSDFPLMNAPQSAVKGGYDGFVTKVSPDGSVLAFSTFLGGDRFDAVNAITFDQTGNVYVAGETYSSNFPVLNAFQPTKAGQLLVNAYTGSAFVTKLYSTGDSIAYSSFLGGEVCTTYCQAIFKGGSDYPGDVAYGIAVDNFGHAYLTGLAGSYTFPLVNSLLPKKTLDTQDSLFVTKVAIAGNMLLYSTLVRTGPSLSKVLSTGGASDIRSGAGKAVALDANASAYVAGESGGSDTFLTTTGAYQTNLAGTQNVIAFKLSTAPAAVTLVSSANPVTSPTSITLTATVSDSSLTGSMVFMEGTGQIGTGIVANGIASMTTTLPVGVHAITAVFSGSGTVGDSPLFYQVVENALACK